MVVIISEENTKQKVWAFYKSNLFSDHKTWFIPTESYEKEQGESFPSVRRKVNTSRIIKSLH
jgi:hypothetical protein